MKIRNLVPAVMILSTVALSSCNSKQYTPREVEKVNISGTSYTIKIADSRQYPNGKNLSIYKEGADKNAYFEDVSIGCDTDGDKWINWVEGAIRYTDERTRQLLIFELNKILNDTK